MPTRPHNPPGHHLQRVRAQHAAPLRGPRHVVPLRRDLLRLGGGVLHDHGVPAFETLACRFSRRLGLDLFHPHEPTAGTRDGDRFIPVRIIAVRVPQATVKRPATLGAAFGEIAHAALRALDAERHRLGVLALGIARAREEFAEASRLDHHGRSALLAYLVGGPIGDLVLLDRPRVVALLRGEARTRAVRPEPAALHLEWSAAFGTLLGFDPGHALNS